ncbi:MAG: isoprenylcysteine carboxylmethyltransferase family protein [Oscillospiraceae bacterium]|nr:isoprenylcysteine carboxylmethyltransferase family protein [Oscillospiraceae bacterium]
MNQKLFIQAIIKFLAGFILISALLFLPAGTLHYKNGWIFIGVLFIPMLIMGIVLMLKNPELLQKRLNAKEAESDQKKVVAFSGIMFLLGFVTAGLNYRFQWLILSDWFVIIFSLVFLLGYGMYAEVLRENAYLSRTVEVQENQKIIDTGLYGIVRHPMYTATILMFLSIPLILGSLISFVIFLFYPVIIIMRIRNEEKILEEGLSGYTEYQKKVKYRLLPFIW